MTSDVLFLLKRREDFSPVLHNKVGLQTGLWNSANYTKDMLVNNRINSNLEVVIDNNDIDREVTKYKPDIAIIEALWVVPSKFTVLTKLHPKVTWIIRLHSEMPFMASEGIAMDWIGDYSDFPNIKISCNAPRMLDEVRSYIRIRNNLTLHDAIEKVIYLPNYYPPVYETKNIDYSKEYIDVSCFGAIRPLKNHLLQAHAALQFAERIDKKLRFHINSGRIEMKGEPVLNNLRGMFQQLSSTGHELINHIWAPREEFLELCAKMDIGMQVSFSETFNIVAADHLSQGVPIVGSIEIPWIALEWAADPVDTKDIIEKLYKAYCSPFDNILSNQNSLTKYTSTVSNIWKYYLKF
jgi:hypothetical protein